MTSVMTSPILRYPRVIGVGWPGAREPVPAPVHNHTDAVQVVILGLALRVAVRLPALPVSVADIPAKKGLLFKKYFRLRI